MTGARISKGRQLADPAVAGSFSNRMRERRFRLFLSLLERIPPPIRLLDVGGTPTFWALRDLPSIDGLDVTCLNLEALPSEMPSVRSIAGDARDMSEFPDDSFDVAFSNSVIEHVGGARSRQLMADEIRRVATRYFVQTPNRYFPIEPHFVFPGFQFLPLPVKRWILMRFSIGWHTKTPDRRRAEEIAMGIELIGEGEMRRLFPEARIHREKLYGLTKSITAYHGW